MRCYKSTSINEFAPWQLQSKLTRAKFLLVVRGGLTKTISSLYPITLRSDRGRSATAASKKLNFSGTVEIAIDAADNLWDVFPAQGNKKAVEDVELFDK